MKTIDSIIFELENLKFEGFNKPIPPRDVKILKNISKLMKTNSYITENQGKLVLKILNENQDTLNHLFPGLENNIILPNWEHAFRVVNKIKEVCIIEQNNTYKIKINYSFDKTIKKVISTLSKKIRSSALTNLENEQNYLLNEKNILAVYDMLNPLKFHFSSDFLDLYKKTISLDQKEVLKNLQFNNLYQIKLQNSKSFEDITDPLIILDRRLRFQYFFEHNFDEDIKNTLTYKIASRNENKIFINQYNYSLDKVFQSLTQLKRNKILLFFDSYSIKDCIHNLNLLKTLVDSEQLSKIGIYFRFDNKTEGKTFNKLIAEYKFNEKLDENTQIAGLDNGNLPKFFLKNNWYPDTVISFTNNLRGNRTDTYCIDCDLIIYYTSTKPLITNHDEIL